MPNKPSDMTWGKYIRQTFGDEAAHQYKNEYLKVYRFAKKTGDTQMNVAAQAAHIVMHPNSQLNTIMKQSLGVTDKTQLQYISATVHTEGFRKQNGNVTFTAKDYSGVRYNKDGRPRKGTMYDEQGRPYVLRRTTLNKEMKKLQQGRITEREMNKLIKEYKGTVEYLAYGSA
ncbi:MAG: hypothetical protein LUD47_06020 [Clostridia bacterium]|nr:hypothetical protein [Clostridia bacterium]